MQWSPKRHALYARRERKHIRAVLEALVARGGIFPYVRNKILAHLPRFSPRLDVAEQRAMITEKDILRIRAFLREVPDDQPPNISVIYSAINTRDMNIVRIVCASPLISEVVRTNITKILDGVYSYGSVEMLEYFLAHGLTLDDVRANPFSLWHAAKYGSLDVLRFVVEAGVSVRDIGFPLHTTPDVNFNTGMYWACRLNRPEIVRFFLDNGLAADDIRVNNYAIFAGACMSGNVGLARLLFDILGRSVPREVLGEILADVYDRQEMYTFLVEECGAQRTMRDRHPPRDHPRFH